MAWLREPSWWESGARRPSVRAVAVVLLVGVALLAHPLYLWPQFGQYPHRVAAVERVDAGQAAAVERVGEPTPTGTVARDGGVGRIEQDDGADSDETVEYEALPAEAQRAFDAARRGDSVTLWTGEDDAAIAALQEHQYVRYDGELYRVLIPAAGRGHFLQPIVRGLLTAAGAVLLTLGGLLLYTGRWSPLTPLRSCWFPVVVALGVLWTRLYDVTFSGAMGPFEPLSEPIGYLPLPFLLVAVGSLLRRRGPRALLPAAVAGGLGLLAVLVVGSAPWTPVVGAVAGGAVLCSPLALLGYRLTAAE